MCVCISPFSVWLAPHLHHLQRHRGKPEGTRTGQKQKTGDDVAHDDDDVAHADDMAFPAMAPEDVACTDDVASADVAWTDDDVA